MVKGDDNDDNNNDGDGATEDKVEMMATKMTMATGDNDKGDGTTGNGVTGYDEDDNGDERRRQ
jgi:hypothetical protein